jgi:hypothetical protein
MTLGYSNVEASQMVKEAMAARVRAIAWGENQNIRKAATQGWTDGGAPPLSSPVATSTT